ncbi:cell wall hydrolase [Bacillus horti]|uniref:Spore germination cell wall hydrolase CwlJ-like protein n=1 Tax=Caldalkalibacillus horti TaxID=77523 RepID=A0ABT9W2S3_9BACI|nr:cell wall hydrolase [Bacillus horti]MDQ0167531.1 spore germination cell wall hydrolase CwlJ-like protein [Bacillus horti]
MAYGDPIRNHNPNNPWNLNHFRSLPAADNMARMIYSEARGETLEGKRGCYHVVLNRIAVNLAEFGGNTINGTILHPYQFTGMTTLSAREPNRSTQAWTDSLDVALNGGANPIGSCLWFNTNALYNNRSRIRNGREEYSFNGLTYREVVEKRVLGNHTFFRVSGYGGGGSNPIYRVIVDGTQVGAYSQYPNILNEISNRIGTASQIQIQKI